MNILRSLLDFLKTTDLILLCHDRYLKLFGLEHELEPVHSFRSIYFSQNAQIRCLGQLLHIGTYVTRNLQASNTSVIQDLHLATIFE